MQKLLKLHNSWTPDSWKNYSIKQHPDWPKKELKQAIGSLHAFPPLIPMHEISVLKNQFKKVSEEKAFILLAGDCAETFNDFKNDLIEKKLQIIFQMSLILSYNLQKPIIKIGRLAGQFAKPRSSKYEIKESIKFLSYMGDAVNSKNFNKNDRSPNPDRLIKAYNQSAATLNLLRSLTEKNIYDIIKYNSVDSELLDIKKALDFANNVYNKKMYSHIFSKDFFTAHEALLLNYEEALTRKDEKSGLWYNCSSHMVWLGYRTNYPESAHIEFLSGIENPIGIKVGPKTDLVGLVQSIQKLNPNNEKGKIILIIRYGKKEINNQLPKLINIIKNSGVDILWMCDPMHGNTFTTNKGFKTRDFDDIIYELECFFKNLKSNAINPSGVHFELTPENVTECISESYNIKKSNIHKKYETACDPRLNKNQSLDICSLITKLI